MGTSGTVSFESRSHAVPDDLSLRFVLVPVVLLVACAALGNLALPKVAQVLTSPGPYSLWLYTLPITLPMLAAIGTIEAVVARWVLGLEQSVGLVATALILTNAVTSVVGSATMPSGTELWPGMLLAFVITVFIETPMLLLLLPKGERRLSLDVWKAGALMNAASYLFLLYVVVSVVEFE